MSIQMSDPARRVVLATSAAFGLGLAISAEAGAAEPIAGGGSGTIRPFHVSFPETELTDLKRRIKLTKWPEREQVADASQGVQLATVQRLAHYWATEHDWHKCEAKLKAVPHFTTEIDGLDIHFIHVRSKHRHALPVIITHGWPGSVIEQMEVIDPLTNPTARRE
jgi:Epoxide hydrolase N terminus